MRTSKRLLGVKLTEQEYKNLTAAAKSEGKTVSAYVRDALLSEAEQKARAEVRIYSEIAQIILDLGGLRTDLYARLAELRADLKGRLNQLEAHITTHLEKPALGRISQSTETEKTVSDTAAQLKKLQAENQKLKDDLAEASRSLAIEKGKKR